MRSPPETLTDGVVVLRRWRPDDAAASVACVTGSLAALEPWMPWASRHYSLDSARQFLASAHAAWLAGEEFHYAFTMGHGRPPQGSFSLLRPRSGKPDTLEVGYWLATELTGRGLASRATALVTRAAFEIGAEAVQIGHREGNVRSAAIPRRLGFVCLGVTAQQTDGDGDAEGETAGGRTVLWEKEKEKEKGPAAAAGRGSQLS